MSQRTRPDGRAVWHPVRRLAHRTAKGCFNFFVGPFLVKLPDGTVQASWTAVAGALMLAVVMFRMMPVQQADGGWVFSPVAWPDVFLAFVTLYVKPINDALKAVAERNPEKLVETLLGRMGVGEIGKSSTRISGVDDRFRDDES